MVQPSSIFYVYLLLSVDEIMHTQLNSPITVNLFRKISILLELILASKLLRAELSKINYTWTHVFKTNPQRTDRASLQVPWTPAAAL